MRLFVAADVSSKAGIVKLQQEMAETVLDAGEARAIERQNFHFVLFFLGEKEAGMVGRITAKLAELRFEPIRLAYAGVGGFPDPAAASAIWVGVDDEGARRLQDLAAKVAAKMKEIGMEPDKPFVPHVTIFQARAQQLEVGRSLAKYRGKTFGSDLIDRIRLRKSNPGPSGQLYSDIFTVDARK